jgi:hypothetical protein
MTQINVIAMSAWTISKNANIDELSREKTEGAAPLSRHCAGFQPTLLDEDCSPKWSQMTSARLPVNQMAA